MYLLESCAVAISMYSKIPMPRVEWNEKNMKYAMCFFPMIGAFIGILEVCLGSLLLTHGVGKLFFAVVMTLLPVVITGGIHMDGFMDTMDAISSYGDREKKLAILKDSHAGAFAILGLGCYLLWSVAVWSEVSAEMLPVIGCGYVLSRSLSGFSVVTFQAAKNSGLVKTFQDGAKRKNVRITMLAYLLLFSALALWLNWVLGLAAIVGAALIFLYYKRLCDKQFGGVTGDLAGYFLQLCELVMLSGVALLGGLL